MKAIFIGLITLSLTLLAIPAGAKKYALNYAHQSGAVYSFMKTDTITIQSLIGGLGNNLKTIIITDYSLKVLSQIDAEHTEMLYSYKRIRMQQFFNKQETIQIDTENSTPLDRNKEILDAFQKLIKANFTFTVSNKGDVTDIQGWDSLSDSLKLSKRDKQSLERYIDSQTLNHLLALTYTKYAEQKIALQSSWTQAAFGSSNTPYQLTKRSVLEKIDKEQFILSETGKTGKPMKTSIKMGDFKLDYIISAKERGERRCDALSGMPLELQFSAYIDGDLPEKSANPETSTALSYIIKTSISQHIK